MLGPTPQAHQGSYWNVGMGRGGCPAGSGLKNKRCGVALGAPTDFGCEGTPLPLVGAGNSRHHHSHSQSLHVNSYFPYKSKRTFLNPLATSEMNRQEKNFRWASVIKNKYSCMKLLKI